MILDDKLAAGEVIILDGAGLVGAGWKTVFRSSAAAVVRPSSTYARWWKLYPLGQARDGK